jgi:membrane-associated phospholipid phosphatase
VASVGSDSVIRLGCSVARLVVMSGPLRSSREKLHRWSLHRISSDAATIKAVQRHRTPFRDALFRVVSLCGDEIAYTLGLPVLAWCMPSHALVSQMIITWALVFYSGHALKDYWQLPRPFRVDKGVACLEQHFVDEYGMPSTHAEAAWSIPLVWLVLSEPAHMALAVASYLFYAVAISFSRIYLGVHSLLDVVGGAFLGLVIAVVVIFFGTALRSVICHPGSSLVAMVSFEEWLTVSAKHLRCCCQW